MKGLYLLALLGLFVYAPMGLAEIQDKTLEKDHGYLLVSMDVSHESASLELARYFRNGDEAVSSRKVYALATDQKFLLIPLKKGKYRISQVSTPYFDLPYQLDTSDSPNWAIKITPKRINYLGHMDIRKERTRKTVFVEMVPLQAKKLDEIKSNYSDLLTEYPLIDGKYYRDDFYMEYFTSEGVN